LDRIADSRLIPKLSAEVINHVREHAKIGIDEQQVLLS
jgi:hypothetical protein